MDDKKATIGLMIIFFLIGIIIIYFSVDSILDYYTTGKITFQLKPTLPRFYGKEALMMQIANIFLGLVFIIVSFTYYRKIFTTRTGSE